MTWKKAHPDEVGESILVCRSTKYDRIGLAVRELIERMAADWLAAGHAKAEAVFMYVNATIGHIFLSWSHPDGAEDFSEEGWPTYYLELPALWQESLGHERGSSHFDDEAHMALCEEVGRVMFRAEELGIAPDYIYYKKFEWSSSASELIV